MNYKAHIERMVIERMQVEVAVLIAKDTDNKDIHNEYVCNEVCKVEE